MAYSTPRTSQKQAPQTPQASNRPSNVNPRPGILPETIGVESVTGVVVARWKSFQQQWDRLISFSTKPADSAERKRYLASPESDLSERCKDKSAAINYATQLLAEKPLNLAEVDRSSLIDKLGNALHSASLQTSENRYCLTETGAQLILSGLLKAHFLRKVHDVPSSAPKYEPSASNDQAALREKIASSLVDHLTILKENFPIQDKLQEEIDTAIENITNAKEYFGFCFLEQDLCKAYKHLIALCPIEAVELIQELKDIAPPIATPNVALVHTPESSQTGPAEQIHSETEPQNEVPTGYEKEPDIEKESKEEPVLYMPTPEKAQTSLPSARTSNPLERLIDRLNSIRKNHFYSDSHWQCCFDVALENIQTYPEHFKIVYKAAADRNCLYELFTFAPQEAFAKLGVDIENSEIRKRSIPDQLIELLRKCNALKCESQSNNLQVAVDSIKAHPDFFATYYLDESSRREFGDKLESNPAKALKTITNIALAAATQQIASEGIDQLKELMSIIKEILGLTIVEIRNNGDCLAESIAFQLDPDAYSEQSASQLLGNIGEWLHNHEGQIIHITTEFKSAELRKSDNKGNHYCTMEINKSLITKIKTSAATASGKEKDKGTYWGDAQDIAAYASYLSGRAIVIFSGHNVDIYESVGNQDSLAVHHRIYSPTDADGFIEDIQDIETRLTPFYLVNSIDIDHFNAAIRKS